MNLYVSLNALKRDIAAGTPATIRDAEYLDRIGAASRWVDQRTGTQFFAEAQTLIFDGEVGERRYFDRDIVSVDAAGLAVDEDGDGVYELTLTEGTDFHLWPPNARYSFRAVDLDAESPNLTSWPAGRRRIQVAGVWGYSLRTVSASALDLGAGAAPGVTSLPVDDGSAYSPGDTLQAVDGSDREWLYVRDVDQQTIIVDRGVNGSTAFTIPDDTALDRIVFEERVRQAVTFLVSRWARFGQVGGSEFAGAPDFGIPLGGAEWATISDLLEGFGNRAVA